MHFWSFWAKFWWVGWRFWRAGCISQDTYLLYTYHHTFAHFTSCAQSFIYVCIKSLPENATLTLFIVHGNIVNSSGSKWESRGGGDFGGSFRIGCPRKREYIFLFLDYTLVHSKSRFPSIFYIQRNFKAIASLSKEKESEERVRDTRQVTCLKAGPDLTTWTGTICHQLQKPFVPFGSVSFVLLLIVRLIRKGPVFGALASWTP